MRFAESAQSIGTRCSKSAKYKSALALAAVLLTACASLAHGAGTDAGSVISNTASAAFEVGGVGQPLVTSNTVQVVVDELLDVSVLDALGGPVAVASPQSDAVVQFSVTNAGNGSEAFRLIADPNISEGGFDPVVVQTFLESNGIPGLQTGAGGDTVYVAGSNDPVLANGESLEVYLASNIPGGLAQNLEGHVALRAISLTIIAESGTDDPSSAAFPSVGTAFIGAGDSGSTAVAGTSHDPTNLLLTDIAVYRVSAAILAVAKSAAAVLDPFGGTTLVPGTRITYELTVSVSGSGAADNVVVSDVLPLEVDYELASLIVAGAAEDDDFLPAGTDASGFDSSTRTISVALGSLAGGDAPVSITFDAIIR